MNVNDIELVLGYREYNELNWFKQRLLSVLQLSFISGGQGESCGSKSKSNMNKDLQ